MKLKLITNDYIFSVLNKIVSLISGFLTAALINRYLSPSLKGQYSYVMNLINFFAIFFNLGIYQSYPRSYRNNINYVKEKYCFLIFIQCFIYIIIAILIGILTNNLFFFISSLMVPAQVLANQLSMIMIVEEVRYRQIIQILSQILRLFFIFIVSIFMSEYVLIILIIYLFINIYICVAYILRIKPLFKLKFIDKYINKNFIKYLLSFGFFSTISELLLIINYKSDVIMLKYYVDYYQIGLYSVGSGIAECIWLLPDAFKEVLFSRTSRSESIKEINFAIRLNIFLSFVAIIIISILGKYIILIYSGNEYLDALTVTKIILLGIPSMILFKITNPLYLANGKQKLYCAILVVSALTNVILNLILIPMYGINGAAIASVIAFSVCGLAFAFFYIRNYKIRFYDIIFLKKSDMKLLINYVRIGDNNMLTKAQIKRRLAKIFAVFYRINLKNKDFTIISNNCWGGKVYDRYSLPYRTPTIGLWMPPNDYIKFLKDLNFYSQQQLFQISYTESHVRELLISRKKQGKYSFRLEDLIIGRLYDIDIIFLHYSNFEIAKEKWEKRIKRINFDNLLVKMNDQNGCTDEDFYNFMSLPYENKIFFTGKKEWKKAKNVLYIEKYEKDGYVVNDTKNGILPLDITKLLNSLLK